MDDGAFNQLAGKSAHFFVQELNDTIGSGEKSVIFGFHDVFARIKFGAALADKDVAGHDRLAPKTFDAESLGIRISDIGC